MSHRLALLTACLVGVVVSPATAEDWPRFRGPNGSGIAADDAPIPATWSSTENLAWSVNLPGPGSSSPIVVGDRVFVTCWTGYGVNRENPGDQQDLRRELVCYDCASGDLVWRKSVDAVLPEDQYGGMFAEHGYASHTPVSDGVNVYAFFGKSGVVAFDLAGNLLWQTSVGEGLDPRRWGSSCSPVLFEDLVIVAASAESKSLVALDKETGAEVWRETAGGFASTWGTPIIVDVDAKRSDLVLAVPFEVWGFNPRTGKLRWAASGMESNSMCASAVSADGVVYVVGGRGGGSLAVRAGGKGEVSQSHVVWRVRQTGRIGTPLLDDGRLHWIAGSIANCIDAATGETIYKSRLEQPRASGDASSGASGGFGSRRGRRGGSDYSSVVAADGKLIYVTRRGAMHVLASGSEFEQLSVNQFDDDEADFSATPAISDGQIFIRSSKKLYCIAHDKSSGA